MNRPIYETEDDRAAQRRVVEVLQICWRCRVEETPPLYCVDYRAKRGEGTALIEIKVRDNEMRRYATYMISLRKIETAIDLATELRHTFLLVVKWTDAIGWVIPRRGEFEIDVGGRRDRGDALDIERVALIPIDYFKVLDAPSMVHRDWWAAYDKRDAEIATGRFEARE